MTIILFLLILGLLIFVHELGHFMVAKFFGIRVDEFGMGLPPRATKLFSYRGTDYTLNWIPFGGFVKIYGEDGLSENPEQDPDYGRSMGSKKWWQQILVLIAGVTMNVLFAWALFSLAFMMGAPTPVSSVADPSQVKNAQLTVLQVVSGSPAQVAGLEPGDVILELETLDGIMTQDELTQDGFTTKIRETPPATPVRLLVQSTGDETKQILVIPEKTSETGYPMIGIGVDRVGTYKEGFFTAIASGFNSTLRTTVATTKAFGQLISDAFRGQADMATLTGPVGLVGVVGDAQQIGFVYVILLTAIISINLAVLNLIPFPALDGGRIVIVVIEAIIRKKIKPNIVGWINGIGFLLLIALMIFVTIKDVIKLF